MRGLQRDVNETSAGATESAGTIIAGKYKLLDKPLGEGGMGTVWMAEQRAPVKRLVAVKLIKAGMDSKAVLARFEAERTALALMDHPNIARILDGGITEAGAPFFVMELVKGTPITEFCDARKLTPKERLELFVPVCQAIQHAHQKGIIHRDIKPSNVLVALYDDRPVPKVIDFGVAKATGQALTEQTLNTGFSVVGTPQYMSPEQATFNQMDIDTRSDIYSLGVLLYELLAGSPPFKKQELEKAGLLEILRVIREEEPPRPSTKASTADGLPSISANRGIEPSKLTGLLRNELDWIVMKALEKDRARRYETANGFAADINRYLAGEAVLAHPPSKSYRLKKFLRKNRGPVLAASLIFVALLAGVIGTTLGLFEARAQRNVADGQRNRAEEREQQAIDAVKRFRDAVADNSELKNNAGLEQLRRTLLQEPLSFFRSLRERRQADNDTRPESLVRLASAAFELGHLSGEIGDKQNALRAYEESLVIRERLARDNPTVTEFQSHLANSHNSFGILLSETGKPTEALASYEQARQIRERLARDNPTVTEFQSRLAASHNSLGILFINLGRRHEARTEFEAALSIYEQLVDQFGNVPKYEISLGAGYCNYGELLKEWGELDESLTWFDKAIRTLEALYEKDQRVVDSKQFLANSLEGRSQSYYRLKKFAEAIKDLDRAVELNPPRYMAFFRSDRARAKAHTDRSGEALAEALEVAAADPKDSGPYYNLVLFNLSCTYAILSTKVADKQQEYADRAVDFLNKAVAAGYDKADSLAKDADLDPLREREDFKTLLAELNEKHPPAAQAKRP